MNTTKMAQYAADAANISCLAALVSTDIAALKSRVKTMSTPTALNVWREVSAGSSWDSKEMEEVRWYIVTGEISMCGMGGELKGLRTDRNDE